MKDVSSGNFGVLIAFVLPGFSLTEEAGHNNGNLILAGRTCRERPLSCLHRHGAIDRTRK